MTQLPAITSAAIERFWSLVDKSAGDEGCWAYGGPRHAQGSSGRFWTGSRYVIAARLAYALDRGVDPAKMSVRVTCQTGGCVNPKHLITLLDEDPPTRRCSVCGEEKPSSDFYKRVVRERRRPIHSCKPCTDKHSREWAAGNPDRAKENTRLGSRRRRAADPVRAWLRGARQRSKRRGLPFDLTAEDLVIPTHCPVLGIELKSQFGGSDGRSKRNSPSLDRIDNTKGYTRDNIVIVSNRVNRIKHDATVEELEAIARFYRQLVDNRGGSK